MNDFKKNVLDLEKLSMLLSKSTFNSLKKTIEEDIELNKEQVTEIANVVKNWAISMGATHYSYWFQPLNSRTAEKHMTFLSFNSFDNNFSEKISSSDLIKTEVDASSFFSGSLRDTFEARGYVVWDPSSPFFIYENNNIKILTIPSVLITFNGDSIDQKLPLLKSRNVLNQKCKELLKYFNKSPNSVHTTVGLEQEYFLIDKDKYNQRDDLKMTNRTLFGIKTPKTQQMKDQYLGIIKGKILSFMEDVENEAYKSGIPVSSRHNEVAPNQFEFAPIFEEANLANDHNQLLMTIMNNVAEKHDLVCLFYEKPFFEVNGSGKHLNFSLADSDGNNLLQIDKENILQFLTFLVIIIQAVYEHSDLLTASIATLGNEYRLGGFEAPPSSISIFLGSFLDGILNEIENNEKITDNLKEKVFSDFKNIPNFFKESSDRNRTSPFAFTGNKFEFRVVGSSQNIATHITFLNTIIVDSIDKFISVLEKNLKKESFEISIIKTLKEIIIKSKSIRYEKDNYSKEWQEELKNRNLYYTKNIFLSLQELISEKNIKLFDKYKILSKNELLCRYDVWTSLYISNKKIEINTFLEMLDSKIVPDILSYKTFLLNDLKSSKDFINESLLEKEKELLNNYSKLINDLLINKDKLLKIKNDIKNKKDIEAINYIYNTVNPLFLEIKTILDELEKKTGDKYWSLLKYKEFLFY